jgi:hypothetical protein
MTNDLKVEKKMKRRSTMKAAEETAAGLEGRVD